MNALVSTIDIRPQDSLKGDSPRETYLKHVGALQNIRSLVLIR